MDTESSGAQANHQTAPAFRKSDREMYERETHYFNAENRSAIEAHARVVSQFIDAVAPKMDAYTKAHPRPAMLELGAGTCLTTLSLRKRYDFSRNLCMDISLKRMQELINQTAAMLQTDAQGVELAEADFSYAIPLPDASFDLIVFDAALHHSCNIWLTLAECHRILRPGGVLVALRESYLATLTQGYALRRLLVSPEVLSGVAENAYTRGQYEYWLRANGFLPEFAPVSPDWKWKLLAPANGLIFSKWSIWAPRGEKITGPSA